MGFGPLGPACCDETGGVWLCLCGDNILIDLADGETGEYYPTAANNNHPECCVVCPDGSTSIVVATVTRTGNDYTIELSAPGCEEGCGPLPYCVECDRNPGFTETGFLENGVGVVLCGDGPTITMIDQGDNTVQITSFYQDVLTVLGTLPCPYVGCTEFSLDDRSRLKLGPDCECGIETPCCPGYMPATLRATFAGSTIACGPGCNTNDEYFAGGPFEWMLIYDDNIGNPFGGAGWYGEKLVTATRGWANRNGWGNGEVCKLRGWVYCHPQQNLMHWRFQIDNASGQQVVGGTNQNAGAICSGGPTSNCIGILDCWGASVRF